MNNAIDYKLLELYVDGEATGPQQQAAEVLLAGSAEAREYVDELSLMQTALRDDVAAAVAAAPLDQLWARIHTEIENAPAPLALVDTPLAAGTGPTPERLGVLDQLKSWWENQRLELALGGLCALAAVFLCVWIVGALPDAATPQQPASVAAEAIMVEQDHTLVVESAEVTEGTMIIDVDPDDPTAPAVVWHFVDDEEEERI